MHRFYAPGADRSGLTVDLPDDEARHLVQVLRLGPGAALRVFDGRGREHEALVTTARRTGVRVLTGAALAAPPEPRVRVTLAAALLKGRKLDLVVRDAVMLGVAAVQPLLTARTEVPARRAGASAAARWTRIAIASAKQCGRAVVPTVAAPLALGRFLAAAPADGEALRILLAEPAAAPGPERAAASLRSVATRPPPDAAVLVVGPEGGWTADEVAAAAEAGFLPTTAGPRTLRAEAAPAAVLSVLRFAWRDDEAGAAPPPPVGAAP